MTSLKHNQYIARYRSDFEWRTAVKAAASSLATAVVATYNLVIAVFTAGNPTWLFALSAYYYALALVRTAVLLSRRAGIRRGETAERKRMRDAKNYLFGGALLVLLTLTYSGIIVLVTAEGFHYEYRGNFLYFMALYAFWKVISASVRAVRYQKYGDYTVQTLRNVDLADGIVSIVALQSALLYAFSQAEAAVFANAMNAAVGGIAGALLLLLGSYMIVKGNGRLKKLRAANG